MAASSSQEIENMDGRAVSGVQNREILDSDKENSVPPLQGIMIPIVNNQITDALWEELSKITAVAANLEFEEKPKVEKAILKLIRKNKGYFPASISALDIHKEMEEDDCTAGQGKAVSPILDKGHNSDGSQHELEVVYQCEHCDREGVKPVFKLVKEIEQKYLQKI